jgi:MFS family permease
VSATPETSVGVADSNLSGDRVTDSPVPRDYHLIPEGTGFASVLRNRPFLAIWSAQFTSQSAQNAVWYVLLFLISARTHASAIGVAGIIIMVQLPTVLFSAVSGVLVDRVNKRLILISTNFIRAAAVTGYFFFSGSVEMLYLITFLVAVVSQPFQPAEGATIPLLVRGEQLITANSLFQATFMVSQISGFAIAPALIQFFGTTPTLFALVALLGYAGVILFLLPPITGAQRPQDGASGIAEASRVFRLELVEGIQSIWQDRPLLLALVQITFAPTVLLLLAETAPLFVKTVLHINNFNSMFFVLAPAGLGMGVGLFVLGHWGDRLRKDRLVVISLLLLSVTIFGLADVPSLAHELWLPLTVVGINPDPRLSMVLTLLPISALVGIEVAFVNTTVQTIVQERAPAAMLGRVLALQQTLMAAFAIPPLLALAGIEAAVGVQGALGLVGVILFLIALIGVYGTGASPQTASGVG